MKFKDWMLFNEDLEANFDFWLKSIQDYANFDEKEMLRAIGVYRPQDNKYPERGDIVVEFNNRLSRWKDIIKRVLKRKNVENLNWLSFSIVYLVVKAFAEEDLELAIDVTKRKIDSRELTKAEIGRVGWMQIGKKALEYVREYLADQQRLSNRQNKKLKKSGDTLKDDENYIKLIAQEEDLELYYLPSLNIEREAEKIYNSEDKLQARKRILCKYGRGTDWCTANPSGHYDKYYMNNNIYIIREKGVPKYQFVSCKDTQGNPQFMDAKDNHVQSLSLKDKDFLKKYASKESSCYKFKLNFPDLGSYLEANIENKKNIAESSLLNIVLDKEFKNISKKDAAILFNNMNEGEIPADTWIDILKVIPEEILNDRYVFSDSYIINIVVKIQYYDYDVLSKKISKERFNQVLDNYKLYSSKSNSYLDHLKDIESSRKKTIRFLLNSGFNVKISLKILDFIVKNSDIGPPEAYTIFDAMFSLIELEYDRLNERNRKNWVNYWGGEGERILDDFARIFGKKNINKIDISRLKERLNLSNFSQEEKAFPSYKYLMVKFLDKYHDKKIGA